MTRQSPLLFSITLLAAATISGGQAFAATPPGISLPDDWDVVAVPMHRGGNLLFVEAKINGQDAGFFMLDTGSVLNILDPVTAARLGLEGSGQGHAVGVGGVQQGKYLKVDSLRLGNGTNFVILGPHTMTTMDVSHLKKLFGERFSGLLGTPLWEKLPYTLDYQESQIKFYRRDSFQPPKDAVEVPLKISDGWPTVPAQINRKHDGTLLLDSGHEGGLDIGSVFSAAHRDLFSGKGEARGLTQGLGGPRADLNATMDELKLLGHRFAKVPSTYRATPHPGGNQPSASIGMLGGQFMRHFRLTFDYQTGRAWAQWRPDEAARRLAGKKELLDAVDYAGMTPLTTAMRNDEPDVFRSLLRAGADPNLPDRRHGMNPLTFAIQRGDAKFIQALLTAKVKLDPSPAGTDTPLMLAAALGRREIAEKILDAGANVNQQRADGATALMLACMERQGEVARLLIHRRANVNLTMQSGVTALQMASEKGDPDVIRALLAARAKINADQPGGLSPLILATSNGRAAAAMILLKNQASVTAARFDGFTPLHGAAEHDLSAVARALLEAGAKIDAANSQGETPLIMAVKKQKLDLARQLLGAGADVRAKTKDGLTPLIIAARTKNATLVELLEKALLTTKGGQ